MAVYQQDHKGYLKSLTAFYGAVFFGQIAFGLLVCYLVYSGTMAPLFDSSTHLVFLGLVLAAMMFAFTSSSTTFQKRLKIAKTKSSLGDKLAGYRAAAIMRYALMEGPCFFILAIFLITGYYVFLVGACMLLAVFASLRPTVNRIQSDLKLTDTERETL